MQKKKFLAGILAILMLIVSLPVYAIDTTVINEKWGKPTFAYGASLTEDEIQETAKLLGIENMDNVNAVPVSGEDLVRYLGDGIASDDSMISSVLVTRRDQGQGVEVDVKTPKNITQISPNQYANAAITAGVTDATILVAATRPVTGESALTGVFKAFDANGEALDQDRMIVAQEEMETTNDIIQENQDKDGFTDDKFSAAITEIKEKLIELKEQQGELATREDIERIINEAFEKYHVKDYVTQEQFQRLLDLFEKYQKTDAINTTEIKAQLENLTHNFDSIVEQLEHSTLIDQLGYYLRELWKTITSFFN